MIFERMWIGRKRTVPAGWGGVVRCLAVAIVMLAGAGCEPRIAPSDEGKSYHRIEGRAMGTSWSVQYESEGPIEEADELKAQVRGLLMALEDRLSTWRPDTDISRFNASASTNWIAVSRELVAVVETARKIHRASGGMLDPTVYPLTRLWGFTSAEALTSLPSEEALAARKALVGLDRIASRVEPPALRKELAGMQIDLSAIAKGYAVDRVSEWLAERGITNHLVEIGGELRGQGKSPKGRAWRVGLELPLVGRSKIGSVVALSSGALATSGDYRNFVSVAGKRYAHLIDPRTGRPLPQRGMAVSVRARSCEWADGWATALTVLGPEAGLAVAEEQGVAADFRWLQDGKARTRSTSHWNRHD